ncbi:MAG: hypothetical protein J6Q27_02845, partial [Clostridia bacterium]|nr:hypothetical protein [Clostridia bacterium]
MKMKKLLSLTVAIVMAIGMLSGCGNGSSGSNTEKFAETDEKLTLTWLGFPRLGGAPEGTTPELLLEEKFNLEIKPLFYEETKYEEKSSLLLAGGEIPDLIYEMDPIYVINHAYQDFLVEVPYDTIEKYAPEYFAYLNEYNPVGWSHSRYEGKNWGVPNVNYSQMVSDVTFWRKDWLDKFGLEVPKTLDETYTALYKFANEDPDGNGKKDTYGFSTGQTKHSFFPSIFGAYGCLPFWWQEVDGKIVYGGVTDACKEALKTLAAWYKDGLIHPEFYTKRADMSTETIGADLASAYQDPTDPTHAINKIKKINPNAETAYGFLPTG